MSKKLPRRKYTAEQIRQFNEDCQRRAEADGLNQFGEPHTVVLAAHDPGLAAKLAAVAGKTYKG